MAAKDTGRPSARRGTARPRTGVAFGPTRLSSTAARRRSEPLTGGRRRRRRRHAARCSPSLVLAVVFDYINGFHDTANAIATSVATRALRPQHAILMAARVQLHRRVRRAPPSPRRSAPGSSTTPTHDAGDRRRGAGRRRSSGTSSPGGSACPSSSSHALIGGLLGATIVARRASSRSTCDGIVEQGARPAGRPRRSSASSALRPDGRAVLDSSGRRTRGRCTERFRRLQVLSAGYMAFAHGSNDAQKTMGIITLALVLGRRHPDRRRPAAGSSSSSATAISLGTAVGGWRIMQTMGQRVVELEPIHGFAAETTAATDHLRRPPTSGCRSRRPT